MKKSDIAAMFGAGNVTTFLGVPVCSSPQEVNAKAAILGVPSATPYASVGPYCAEGPAAIRAAAAAYGANLAIWTSTSASRSCPAARRMPATWVTCHMAMTQPPTAKQSDLLFLPFSIEVRCHWCWAATTPSPSPCCRLTRDAASSPLSRSMPTSTGVKKLMANAGVVFNHAPRI
jgi:hypothetical protein